MPKFLEELLKKEAEKKGYTGKKKGSYIFGAMNNLGFMKGNKETAKGKEAERKHKKTLREKMQYA